MKTRQLLFTLGIAACTSAALAQNPRIVLQGSGDPQVFTVLEDAIAAAQPNDKLYFSGGTFTAAAGEFIVDKPLHWIGAGICPDSTNVTARTILKTVDGNIVITTAASGSSFTGIHFFPYNGGNNGGMSFKYGTSNSDDAPENMVFERCSFNCFIRLGYSSTTDPDPNPPGSSSNFNECKFYFWVNGGGITSITFTRCDFSRAVEDFQPSGLFIDHCILRDIVLNSSSFTAKNSVILGSQGSSASNGLINNCLLVGSSAGSNVMGLDNIYNQPLGSIFLDDTDGNFQWSDDHHLAGGSPGIGAADDGTDIGIYGSPAPSKMGVVPYNPHFSEAIIDPSTNSNGELPVNIRVIAQPY